MTDDHPSGVCPEPEQLAAYVDGRVTAEERAAIQRHLADCEDCREVVADAVRLRDESDTQVLPFWRRRKTQAIGGGILALAASLILVVQVRPELNPFRRPTPYQELVTAVGTNRTIEARLTGGFQYGPLRRATRGMPGTADTEDYQLLAAVARVRTNAQSGSAADQHALGVAHLTVGEYDDAVTVLRSSAERVPSPATFSDLAAAYLARAAERGGAEDHRRALDAADRALRMDPTLSPALFNRALALERLGSNEAAERAWKAYLVLDAESPWAEEARQRR